MHTVLLVEDDKMMRDVLASRLKSEGFNIIEAGDGEEGLKIALSDHPDLVLLDNKMPNMSGFAMLKRLREYDNWGGSVPVIFFSNVEPASRDEREDLESIQPTDYLIKSDTDLGDIVKRIKEVLGNV